MDSKVHYFIQKSPPLDPIQSRPKIVRPIDPCLSKV
jgi:hypothetical protein